MVTTWEAALIVKIGVVFLLGVASPGANFAYLLRSSMFGRREAFMAAVGFSLGAFIWTSATLAGLASIFAKLPQLRPAMALAGSAYLVFIGIRIMRLKGDFDNAESEGQGQGSTLLSALFVNLLNPKSAIFFISIMGSLLPTRMTIPLSIGLVLTTTIISFFWYGFLGALFSSSELRKGGRRIVRSIAITCGVGLVCLGSYGAFNEVVASLGIFWQ